MTWQDIFNAIAVILFIAIVVVVRIAWLETLTSFWLRLTGRTAAADGNSALKILEERYARGEIDDEEFIERRRRLLERP